MKKFSFDQLMRLAMAAGTEIASFYSIWLLLGIYVMHMDPLLLAGGLWAASLAGGTLALWVSDKHRRLLKITVAAGGVLLVIGMLYTRQELATGVLGALLAAAAYRGILLTSGSWTDRFPLRAHLTGVGLTLALFIISYKLPDILTAIHGLYLAGLAALAVWLLRRNAQHIRNASLIDENLPIHLKGIVAVNRFWSLVIIIGIIAIGATTFLGEALAWLWTAFTAWLRDALSSDGQEDQIAPTPIEMPQQQFPLLDKGPAQASEAGIWMQILQFVVGAIVLVGLLYLVYRFLRFAVQGLQKLLRYLSRPGTERIVKKEYGSYIDEVRRIPKSKRKRKLKLAGEVRPQETAGLIRYYYRQMLRQASRHGFRYRSSDTPNEVGSALEEHAKSPESQQLSNEMIALYNLSRYGEQEIKGEQVADWEQRWKGRRNRR